MRWELAFDLWRSDLFCRIGFEFALAHKKLKKRAQGSRAFAQPMSFYDRRAATPSIRVSSGDLSRRAAHLHVSPPKKMRPELLEIARIIAQRMRAQIALVSEVLEELLNVGTQAASLRVLPIHAAARVPKDPYLLPYRKAGPLPDLHECKQPFLKNGLRYGCNDQNTRHSKIGQLNQAFDLLD